MKKLMTNELILSQYRYQIISIEPKKKRAGYLIYYTYVLHSNINIS